jgi:hypothetical protein
MSVEPRPPSVIATSSGSSGQNAPGSCRSDRFEWSRQRAMCVPVSGIPCTHQPARARRERMALPHRESWRTSYLRHTRSDAVGRWRPEWSIRLAFHNRTRSSTWRFWAVHTSGVRRFTEVATSSSFYSGAPAVTRPWRACEMRTIVFTAWPVEHLRASSRKSTGVRALASRRDCRGGSS